jgi:Inhibitor of growth proteins N-terminal histone-binding
MYIRIYILGKAMVLVISLLPCLAIVLVANGKQPIVCDIATACPCSTKMDELRELQQQYILQAEDKVLNLNVVEDIDKNGKSSLKVMSLDGKRRVIPVTGELTNYVHPLKDGELNSLKRKIDELSEDCLQMADEKVAATEQAYKLIDATVQRLDQDLAAMEALLQVRVGATDLHALCNVCCICITLFLCIFAFLPLCILFLLVLFSFLRPLGSSSWAWLPSPTIWLLVK